MRVRKLWRKAVTVGAVAFGIFGMLFFGYQLYSAVVHGTILQAVRGGDWVTFQRHPISFVSSAIVYLLSFTFIVAGAGAAVFAGPMSGHWRSRQFVDDAIRQGPEER